MTTRVAGALLLFLLTACASKPVTQSDPASPGEEKQAQACAAAPTPSSSPDTALLQPHSIRVVNWNIRKGSDPDWAEDLQAMETGADIILLQEVSPALPAINGLTPLQHVSFAEGYSTAKRRTGVLTWSRARPLKQCSLVAREPWLGTRKAMLVTIYAIADSDQSLLVLNVHGVNFSINARELAKQIREAETVIRSHDGPVLFAGDFNTWRAGRIELLEAAALRHRLKPVAFAADHRKRVFGHPLDHIYTRGLVAVSATSKNLTSSDHNPLLAEFRLGPVTEPTEFNSQ